MALERSTTVIRLIVLVICSQTCSGARDFEGTPIPEDAPSAAGDNGRMEAVIEQLKGQIHELQQQLDMRTNATHEDPYKLKPIDVKDIEKPEKYDNNVSKFVT